MAGSTTRIGVFTTVQRLGVTLQLSDHEASVLAAILSRSFSGQLETDVVQDIEDALAAQGVKEADVELTGTIDVFESEKESDKDYKMAVNVADTQAMCGQRAAGVNSLPPRMGSPPAYPSTAGLAAPTMIDYVRVHSRKVA